MSVNEERQLTRRMARLQMAEAGLWNCFRIATIEPDETLTISYWLPEDQQGWDQAKYAKDHIMENELFEVNNMHFQIVSDHIAVGLIGQAEKRLAALALGEVG